MSAPSAHPNRCTRHPSLSSPMCLSPQPTLNLFSFALPPWIDTVMFSAHKSFTGFKTGSPGYRKHRKLSRVKMYPFSNPVWRYTRYWDRPNKALLCYLGLLESLTGCFLKNLSLYSTGNDDECSASLSCGVHDLASSISVLWPSLCFNMGYLTESLLTHIHTLYCGAFIICLLLFQSEKNASLLASIKCTLHHSHIYLCITHAFHIPFLISIEATYCHTNVKAEIALYHRQRATEQSHFKACLKIWPSS